MANPQIAYINTWVQSGVTSMSADLTFSFDITGGFEAFIPVYEYCSAAVSIGGQITAYRSTDNRNTWESVGSVVGAFSGSLAAAARTQQRAIRLETGQYLIRVQTSTQSVASTTVSVGLATAFLISAYD